MVTGMKSYYLCLPIQANWNESGRGTERQVRPGTNPVSEPEGVGVRVLPGPESVMRCVNSEASRNSARQTTETTRTHLSSRRPAENAMPGRRDRDFGRFELIRYFGLPNVNADFSVRIRTVPRELVNQFVAEQGVEAGPVDT